jgi:small subunit ribosomal protein S8
MKLAVAEVLEREGYLSSVEKPKSQPGKVEPLVVSLAFKGGKPAIQGVKRLSKASRRMYLGVRDIHSVKRGHGLLLLSTPKGIMTGKQAQEARVGGEVLFEIW